ncbi:MAG: outer membrane protein assembly factor BamB family protein, partial [Planctomycetota bacterium]
EEAREHIRKLGLYGKVSVERWSGGRLPYTDNLVNLLVAEGPGAVPNDEIMRVLCPLGVAYTKQAGRWTKTVKPRPKEIGEWTHFLCDAPGNAVANDTVVGPPRHYQWIAGPRWARSHDHLSSTSALVSANGRIFYIVDEGPIASVALPPRWRLVARDAFSGVLLWKREVDPWEGHLRNFRSGPSEIARRLVAAGDRVYVTLGYGKCVTALDAATGEVVRTYDQTAGALEIIHHDGALLVVVGDRAPDNTNGAAKPVDPKSLWLFWAIHPETPPKKRIVAIDPETGRTLWKKDDADTAELMPTTLAAAGGRVFFQSHKEVVALDAPSGKVLWRAERPVNRRRPSWSAPTLVVSGDVVLCADRQVDAVHPGTDKSGKPGQWTVNSQGGVAPQGKIIAFSADSGTKLWESPCRECYNAPVDVFVADGLVWSGNLVKSREPGVTAALDLRTGEVKRKRPNDQKFFKIAMSHHRCYRNKATVKYLVLGRDGIEFIDLATGKGAGHAWVRGACQYGVMPCNGLVYAPHHSCACHIESKLDSFNVLAAERTPSAPKGEGAEGKDGPARLERGPAYGKAARAGDAKPDDWPTYRHDAARTGRASSVVPAALKKAWEAELGAGELSSLVVAGGKVYVARIDEHTVCALDAETGEKLWTFTAGGRVDSPPTIYEGMAIFGCADGWIYCLRAADGALAWRFRAAPEERRIVSYDQIESVWPVHGNVLVVSQDGRGIVYAVAGRTSFLDGGMRLLRLDVATGEELSATRITGAALPDVLSSDGANVYLRHRRFDMKGVEQKTPVAHLYSAAGFLDGSWWHRTYWIVGTGMRSNWGGWPVSGGRFPAGRLLVLDGADVYGFGRLNQYNRNGSHVGLGRMRYLLYAYSRPKAGAKEKPAQARRRGRRPPAKKATPRWSERIGLLARAMVLSERTIFVAGPPDVFQPGPEGVRDPYRLTSGEALREQDAALAGKRGGILRAVSAASGEKLAEYRLDAPPAWDAMAVARGRLYFCTAGGKVVCMRGPGAP